MHSKRPQQRVKSAYFSDDNSSFNHTHTDFDSSIVAPADMRKQQPVVTRTPNDTNIRATLFPNQRAVLWNRSNYGGATVLSPATVLHALRIPPQSVTVLMQQLFAHQGGHSAGPDEAILMLGHLESAGALSEGEVYSLEHCCPSSARPENFVISLSSEQQQHHEGNTDVQAKVDEHLKIPVSLRSTQDYDLLFEEGATSNMLNNLGKGLYKGKSFSLRSCLRLRAAARVHCSGPEGRSRVTAPLRVEVIAPNLSFSAVQVGVLPIFTTASTSRLLEDQTRSNMGYITLNQTRQLVLLPSSSERASVNCEVITAPVVGLWVSMPAMEAPLDFSAGQDTAEACCPLSVLQNPYVWGACVKYLLTEHIQDKVWVAPSTFLLTLFATFGVFHFEITSLSATRSSVSSVSSPPRPLPLPLPLEELTFACQEFAVDLEAQTRTQAQTPGQQTRSRSSCSELAPCSRESVIGKLRSTVALSYQNLFSSVPAAFKSYPAVAKGDRDQKYIQGTQGQLPRQQQPPVDRRPNEVLQKQTVSDGTSLPEVRDSSLLTTRSMTSTATVAVNDSTEKRDIRLQSDVNVIPMEAYLAQQREIDQLRAQVAHLQEQLALSSPDPSHPHHHPADTASYQCETHHETAVDTPKVNGDREISRDVDATQQCRQQQEQQEQQRQQQQQQQQQCEEGNGEFLASGLNRDKHRMESDSDLDVNSWAGSSGSSGSGSGSKFDDKLYTASSSDQSSACEEEEQEEQEMESHMSVQFVKETFQPLEAPSLFDLDLFIASTSKKQGTKKQNKSKSKTKSSTHLSTSEITQKSGGTPVSHDSSPLDALLPVAPSSVSSSSQHTPSSPVLPFTQDCDNVIHMHRFGDEAHAQQQQQYNQSSSLGEDESEAVWKMVG